MNKKFIILNYHDIVGKSNSKLINPFSIKEEAFNEQLKLIFDSKIPIITPDQFIQKSFPELSILLTFDDGNESLFSIAKPILDKLKIKVLFFPIISRINLDGYLNLDQIKILQEEGHLIGNHSYSHIDLSQLKREQLEFEIKKSKETFLKLFQINSPYFNFPYGNYNNLVIDQLKIQGFTHFFTTHSSINSIKAPQFIFNRFNLKAKTNLHNFSKLLKLNPVYISKMSLKGDIVHLLKKFPNKKFPNKIQL